METQAAGVRSARVGDKRRGSQCPPDRSPELASHRARGRGFHVSGVRGSAQMMQAAGAGWRCWSHSSPSVLASLNSDLGMLGVSFTQVPPPFRRESVLVVSVPPTPTLLPQAGRLPSGQRAFLLCARARTRSGALFRSRCPRAPCAHGPSVALLPVSPLLSIGCLRLRSRLLLGHCHSLGQGTPSPLETFSIF